MNKTMSADLIIAQLNLSPHPEGGHYRQTWIAKNPGRATGTSIYFLLKADEISHWHRVDATEIWYFHTGSPLIISVSETDQGPKSTLVLGPDIQMGHQPQIVIPEHHWQTARSTGEFTLVSCSVSPGFRFAGFELAEHGFEIQ